MKKIALMLTLGLVVGLTSCYQEPQFGTAKITVVDLNDFRVPNANVTLSQDGSHIISEGLTDMQGEYNYTHDPALEVILDVEATEGTRTGNGSIRIKPNQTSQEIVRIQ